MIKCKKHRGYKAIRKPRTKCKQCWLMWKHNNNEEQERRTFKKLKVEIKKKDIKSD